MTRGDCQNWDLRGSLENYLELWKDKKKKPTQSHRLNRAKHSEISIKVGTEFLNTGGGVVTLRLDSHFSLRGKGANRHLEICLLIRHDGLVWVFFICKPAKLCSFCLGLLDRSALAKECSK